MTHLNHYQMKARIGALLRKVAERRSYVTTLLMQERPDETMSESVARGKRIRQIERVAEEMEAEVAALQAAYRLSEPSEVAAAKRALRAVGQPVLMNQRADELENWLTSELVPFATTDERIPARIAELQDLVQALRKSAQAIVQRRQSRG